jgi:uncharacterized protein (TIGR00297 family)
MQAELLIGFCSAAAISLLAWRLRALDGFGALAALAMGTIVFGLGGIMPSAALVLFFVSGSILSALPGKPKVRTGDESHGRSWKQVAANGSVPTLLVLATLIFPSYREPLLISAVAAIAAAAADSWSTEIGTRYGGIAHDILSWKPVVPGLSGGVSLAGFLAALIGATLIACSTYPISSTRRLQAGVAVILAGFCGAVSDSIIGSSLQGRYRCEICGELTETTEHCDRQPLLVKGKGWIDNNAVNLAATAIGALFCALELDFWL